MLDTEDFAISALEFLRKVEALPLAHTDYMTRMHRIYGMLVQKIAEETQVLFTSMFARLTYISTAYQVHYKEMYILHSFRRWGMTDSDFTETTQRQLASTAVHLLLIRCINADITLPDIEGLYADLSKRHGEDKHEFKGLVRVQFQSIDTDHKIISAQLSDEPYSLISVSYGVHDRNEDFTAQIQWLHESHILPITAHLIEVEIDEAGLYKPSSIVMEPDMLYDVTAISECFGAFAHHEMGFLLRKFEKRAASKAILVGNIANYILDQLLHDPQLPFLEIQKSIFAQDPLSIACLSNEDVKEILHLLEGHYVTIKEVVNTRLTQVGLNKDNYLVEPSFFSAKYGIQGRLDLFGVDSSTATIIELKSGKTFRPNNYGLNNNHYHQTLLYDMLIESVYGYRKKRNCFILYSQEGQEPLRYAPSIKAQQREAIKVRNHLYLHDRSLQHCDDFVSYIRDYAAEHADNIKGYQRKNTDEFIKAFQQLEKVERTYCHTLVQFTLNELLYNKLGCGDQDRSRGLAAMWREPLANKIDKYNVINHLTLHSNQAEDDDPQLIYKRSSLTAELSNFREGDMGVVYPYQGKTDDVLHSQVFKITILEIGPTYVSVRLRSRQDNAEVFQQHTYWNIEHDSLENGYHQMTRSILEFAQAPTRYRRLIMGLDEPSTYETTRHECSHLLTTEQSQIFSEILSARDYYLLWGPPGTGKTSVVLREVAHHYISHTQQRVLFLAYTNRAVDEICEAILSIDPDQSFIRIGSRYSTGEDYRKYLINEQIKSVTRRHELRLLLDGQQVYVATIASILGKDSLFDLLQFDVAVIDEASQILETSLIGLLSRVKKWILIGDHQQLPAVVQQPQGMSEVTDESLRDIGFQNYNNSLFERLYRTAQSKNWDHAIGQLSYQGRMHEALMQFPSEHFYNNNLHIIPSIDRLHTALPISTDLLLNNRRLYIPSPADTEGDSIKINRYEAIRCIEILERLTAHLEDTGVAITDRTFGIITPYRAQIAMINKVMIDRNYPYRNIVTIDTVERYQGGARDIIIMSAAINYSFQLDALVSLSAEGVDRKFNVALTRARERFILIGNQALLSQSHLYKQWIDTASTIEITEDHET